MAETPIPVVPNESDRLSAAESSSLWLEVTVVMALAWLTPFFSAAASWAMPANTAGTPFRYDMLYQVVSAVQVLAPLCYIIWRSGSRWSEFGIKPVRPLIDLPLAIGLLIANYIVYFAYWIVIAPLDWAIEATSTAAPTHEMFSKPDQPIDYVLLAVGCLAIGAFEEITMRGYLVPRLERLLGSSVMAVLISAVVFASYHMYQQPLEMLSVFVTGLVLGAAFCMIRRVWPLVIAHALMDVIFYVQSP